MKQLQQLKFNPLARQMLLALLMLFSLPSMVQAQNEITVSGVVTSDEDNKPVIGATVLNDRTTLGVASDNDGKYSIKAQVGDVLVFSYIGMKNKSVKVTGATLNVVMEIGIDILDEVVVIGYGEQKKKEVTGAVAQLKSEDINEIVTADVGSAMQGRIAGVNVTAASGEPGSDAEVQIRGITSLNGSNTPLYVVDGIPQNGVPRLSRNEIGTIDVLKDAASASVYGTRGAAGVILITTKRGESGKTRISFDQSFGVQRITSGIDLMETSDQIRFDTLKSAYVIGAPTPFIEIRPEWATNNTNLRDYALVDNALTQTYDLGITGGTKNFSYNVAAGLYDQGGVIVNSGFRRYNARINTAYNKGRLSMRAIAAFSSEERDQTDGGLLTYSLRYKPYFPEVDIDATNYEVNSGGSENGANYLLQRLKRTNSTSRDRINASLNLNYNLLKGLNFRTNIGTGITNIVGREFVPPFSLTDENGETETDPTRSYTEMNFARNRTYSWDVSLNYKKKIGKHNFTGLVASSIDGRSYEYFEAGRQGVANGNISVINGGTINPYSNSGAGTRQNYNIITIGTLGRLQYNYQGKYLLNASIRRDGSSKFAPENRWGFFPSVSAGWNVAREKFWKPFSDISDNIKVRASYGTTGNESFPAYRYATVIDQGADYVFGDDIVLFGAVQRTFANSQVKWETSAQANFGIDMGFWKNKLLITADYYNTQKRDMLFPVRVPASAGALTGTNADLILNAGNMTNKGFEFSANYRTTTGGMNWNIGGTFTKNINKITSINGSTDLITNPNSIVIIGDPASVTTTLAVGYEVGAYFLFETDGVIQTAEELAAYQVLVPSARLGDMRFVDTNGDSTITELDKVYKGSGLPDFEFGFNLKWSYKSFDFNMQWYGAVGHQIMNGTKAFAYSEGRHQDLVDMWTPENPTSNIPIHRGTSKEHVNYFGSTDYWLEDGTYLRLRTVSLGYSMPTKVLNTLNLGSLRVYVSAQNPLTFTDYTGYDPEVGGSVVLRGIDRGRYPTTSMYLFGIQLDF